MGEVQTTLLSKRWRVVGAGVLLVLLGIILHWTTAGQRDWAERRRFSEEKPKAGVVVDQDGTIRWQD